MSYQDKPALDELYHYGIPRRSGRYPWGSGEDPYQRTGDFLSRVEMLRKENFTFTDEDGKVWTGDTAIAKAMGISTTEFRAEIGSAKEERRLLSIARAKSLKEDGLNPTEIGRQMGVGESTVRSWLTQDETAKNNQARATAEILKKMVDEKGMLDVGTGVERELGISKEKLKQALYLLEKDGYITYGGGVPQVTNPGKQTNLKVLCPPGTEHKEIYNFDQIHSVVDYVSYDGGETYKKGFVYPESIDSKRVKILLADDIGTDGRPSREKDGVVEIRRGVPDLDLGNSHYAQVRIMVDGTHYIKGMAVYSDNIPDGVDVVFNTSKTDMAKTLKPIKNDPDNPFGSLIKEHGGQSYYIDKDGKERLSLINKRAEEGDWGEWADKLPSQFLSKQTYQLAKKQLGLAASDKIDEFDEICSLTNPTVKKALLQSFADDCDSAAVHLKAAALPRQKYQVILPITSLKDNEIYAPNYENGEQVALVRYPHGGTFEIPILTVNNKHAAAKRTLGNALDAVGINSSVAERLSGADFDGDTVMVIPTGGKVNIKSTQKLKGLTGFDPRAEYPAREGMKVMKNTQNEMGKISNLITDMTLLGANTDELARAVRHSMVVIDAEKHKLDYKKSEIDNDIAGLKKRYQAHPDDDKYGGAATLISRAKSQASVDKRQGTPSIDPDTGKLVWKTADDLYYTVTKTNKRTGEVTTETRKRTQPSTKMAETDDAKTLISKANTPMENLYADYANTMKSLANKARKTMVNTGKIEYSASAKKTYQTEVDSLNAKLNVALKNAPRERQAQIMANAKVQAQKQADPDMTRGEIKKAGQRALTAARIAVGAKRNPIDITDREWEAIQAGAISESLLVKIINHTDTDSLRQRATPRATTTLSRAKINKIASMSASGYTTSEIAKSLGVSPSTVSNYLKGKE